MDLKKNERSDGAKMNDIIKMFNEITQNLLRMLLQKREKTKEKLMTIYQNT